MNVVIGWALAVAAVVSGAVLYGWPGVALGLSVVVFWMLLQFSRTMRVLRRAGDRPVGFVDSTVMLNAKLEAGMTLLQVLALTRSLGRRVGDGEDPERWCWADPGGAQLTLELRGGRLSRWTLERSAAEAADAPPATAQAHPPA